MTQRALTQKELTAHALLQRSEEAQYLRAPYTVLMRAEKDDEEQDGKAFSWIAFSMGRPRNVVWGTVVKTDDVVVNYGCHWERRRIINDLMDIRKSKGYKVVSTFARDQINSRILANLIYDVYKGVSATVNYKDIEMTREDIEEAFTKLVQSGTPLQNYKSRQGLQKGQGQEKEVSIATLCHELASSLVKTKNITDIARDNKLPQYAIRAVHDFLEHNPTLSASFMPAQCPNLTDCDGGVDDEVCEMYGLYDPSSIL